MKNAVRVALASCALACWLPAAQAEEARRTGTEEPASAEPEGVGDSLKMRMESGAPNQYFFRGLLQNDKGFIWQANSNLDVALYDTKALRIIIPVGFWFSIHPGNEAKHGKGPAAWYESRLSGGLALANDAFRADARLIIYSSPNGTFRDVYELNLSGDFNDDVIWTKSNAKALFRGVFPGVTLAQELHGARDGKDPGTYLELRLAPRARLLDNHDWTIDAVVPASMGLSLHDYYQMPLHQSASSSVRAEAKTRDHTLGYASIGLMFDIKPRFVPRRLGLYSIQPSLQLLTPNAQKGAAPRVDSVEAVAQIWSVLSF